MPEELLSRAFNTGDAAALSSYAGGFSSKDFELLLGAVKVGGDENHYCNVNIPDQTKARIAATKEGDWKSALTSSPLGVLVKEGPAALYRLIHVTRSKGLSDCIFNDMLRVMLDCMWERRGGANGSSDQAVPSTSFLDDDVKKLVVTAARYSSVMAVDRPTFHRQLHVWNYRALFQGEMVERLVVEVYYHLKGDKLC